MFFRSEMAESKAIGVTTLALQTVNALNYGRNDKYPIKEVQITPKTFKVINIVLVKKIYINPIETSKYCDSIHIAISP